MTGYQSKKTAARDKVEQWDTPSEAFNAWWNGEYDDSTNPFTKDTFAYWAWAGWQAALAQPVQEPDEWFGGWRVQDFHDACKKPAQEPATGQRWTGKIDEAPARENTCLPQQLKEKTV
jgi:hypothetical protein